MLRVLFVLGLLLLSLGTGTPARGVELHPLGAGAPLPPDCSSVKLVGASEAGGDHVYKFAGQCNADDKTAPVTVLASWKASTKQASENITVGGDGGGEIKTTLICLDDPFITSALCQVLGHSNTSSHNVLSWTFPLARGLTTLAEATAKSSSSKSEPPSPPKAKVQPLVIVSPKEGHSVTAPFALLVKPADGAVYSSANAQVDMQVWKDGPGDQGWSNTYQNVEIQFKVPRMLGDVLPAGKHRLKVRAYGPTDPKTGVTPIVETKWHHFSVNKVGVAPKGDGSSQKVTDSSSKGLSPASPSSQGAKVAMASPSVKPAKPALLPVKLVTTRGKGANGLEVVLSNPNPEGQPLPVAIELRLGRTVVGKGQGQLQPREQRGTEILWKLPPGMRGPVDVDVFVNGEKVGSAKLLASG